MNKIIIGGVAGVVITLAIYCFILHNENENLKLKLQVSTTNSIQLKNALDKQNAVINENRLEVESYKKELSKSLKEYEKQPKKSTSDNCIGVLKYLF